MFSRTIIADKKSEKICTHQRIDRAARRQIEEYLPEGVYFPSAKEIIHFEGANGPDGLGTKRNVGDEPWQFLIPGDDDGRLVQHIRDHLHNMHYAKKKKNHVRMSFEAAWMAHMIVDGLTPAHQYPFKDKMKELDNRELHEIDNQLKRIFLPGNGEKSMLTTNWEHMGPKGLATNHILFEGGVEFIIYPLSPKQLMTGLSDEEVKKAKTGKFIEMYYEGVYEVAEMKMFERYCDKGWTGDLAYDVRTELLPKIVKYVSLGWLAGFYCGK